MAKPDYVSGAGGAVQGGVAGFGMGGPVGAAIGGSIGAGLGMFGGGGKKKKKKKKLTKFDKNQQQLHEESGQALHGEGPLADLYNYDPESANAVFDQNTARPAYRNFNENIIPGITGQFRSQGLSNSSYTGDALSKAGRDVQENLDGLRAKYLHGEQQDARNAKRQGLDNFQNRSTFDYEKPDTGGGFDIGKILGSLNPKDMDAIKNYFSTASGGV